MLAYSFKACNSQANMWTIQVLLLAICVQYGIAENIHITSGASGEICGGTKCLAHNESMCVNGTCKCNPEYRKQTLGDGDLACYKKNKIWAVIRGEPQVRTYDNHHYELSLPCRFLATHFNSTLKIKMDKVGTCQCEMYSWNKKHRGKMYPAGYDIACDIKRTDGHENFKFATRKHGIAKNGIYTHYANVTLDYLPHGPWTNADHIDYNNHGLIIKCNYNDDNNMAKNHLRQCGFRVEFRPFDKTFGRYQRQVNGLAWGLSCANHPQLKSNERTLTSGPEAHAGITFEQYLKSTESADHDNTRLSGKQFFMFQALLSEVPQNQPDASPHCATLQNTAALCDTKEKKKHAADRCFWVIVNQPFLACVDKSDNADLGLFLLKRCFEANCRDGANCLDFQADLDTYTPKVCKAKASKWIKFMQYRDGSICN